MSDCGCDNYNDCNNCGDGTCNQGCNPCRPSSTIGAQGPQGPAGATGAAGTNGVNAFTTLTANFTQPAVSATVVASVANSTWIALNQNVYVAGGGYYKATALPSSAQVTLQNLGVTGNAAPGATVSNGSKLSPSGAPGPDLVSPLPIASGGTGQSTANAAFNALSPMTTNGDLITRSGGAASRVGIGSAGQVLTVSGGAPAWATNAPAAANITGQVAIANGGTGASTAAGARTNLNVPQLTGGNSGAGQWTGAQTFNQGSGLFTVTNGTFALLYLVNGGGSSFNGLYDSSGADSVMCERRFLSGQWSIAQEAYVNANASTYTVPAFSSSSRVRNVLSSYSLTGTQTITLPAGVDGRVVAIVDAVGGASTNAITINRAGSDTIVGGTSYTINLNYGGVKFLFFGATNTWIILP